MINEKKVASWRQRYEKNFAGNKKDATVLTNREMGYTEQAYMKKAKKKAK